LEVLLGVLEALAGVGAHADDYPCLLVAWEGRFILFVNDKRVIVELQNEPKAAPTVLK
jgi:hypothetical protein